MVNVCSGIASDQLLFTSLLDYRVVNTQADNSTEPDSELMSQSEDELDLAVVDGGYERTNYPLSLAVNSSAASGFSLEVRVVNQLNPKQILGYVGSAI